MIKKKFSVIILFLWIFPIIAYGQSLSLKQCIGYAFEHNSNIKISQHNERIAQKKVNSQIGTLLPQVDLSCTVTNNLKLSTQLMPGELLGTPGVSVPVTFGSKYDLSAGLQLNQKILDVESWFDLKTANVEKEQSEINLQNTNEETTYNVSLLYYQTLIIQKQIEIYKATLKSSESTLLSTELKYKNGLALKLDVDKIRVSFNNTKSQLDQTELSYKQSLNNLKYQMGMPLDNNIELSDTLLNVDKEIYNKEALEEYSFDNRIDYKLQKVNLKIQGYKKDKMISQFLPSLSFFADYNFEAMRNAFDFFESEKDWYKSYSIGLKLSVPIFDGLQKVNNLAESQIEVEKVEENIKLFEQSIRLELSNYEMQYNNAVDNLKNEKENLALAESVFQNTQLEFQQGKSSSYDLVQAESSLRESQNNYFNKLLNLYIARIDLEKSKGTLINFINNLK
jgi:outer membrane protein